MSSSRVFKILDEKFTQDEIQKLLQIFESQRYVADFYKEYGQVKLRELLSFGQGQKKGQGGGGMQTQGQKKGQGGGGMQTQQQQQQDPDQLKGLIVSLGGRVPQTSNIRQLKKLLAQTQRIHKLREIIPSMPEDTLTYLLSKGLNDEEIIEIGLNITEEDINFMVECVPDLKNKRDFLDNLLYYSLVKFKQLIVTNKNLVDNLSKTTGFSRGAILKLLKKRNSPKNIVLLSTSLQSFKGALASDKLNHVTMYSEEDRIKDDTINFLKEEVLKEEGGLNYYQIIEVALNFTEGDLDVMVRSFPKLKDKQTLLNDIAKRIRDGTIAQLKKIVEERKKVVEELSRKTRLSREEIIRHLKSGKKKQDIQKMRGTQHQPQSKKPKLSPGQQQKPQAQDVKYFLKTMKVPLDEEIISILLSKGSNKERILKYARDFNKHHLTNQDIQFLIKAGPGVQSTDDVINLVLHFNVERIKQLIQTSKEELKVLLEKTEWSQGDIIRLFKQGKSADEIFEMKPKQHTRQRPYQQKLKIIEEVYKCNRSLANEILTLYPDIVRDFEEAMLKQQNKQISPQTVFKRILSQKLLINKNYFRRFPKNPQYNTYQDKSQLFQKVKRLLKLNEQQAADLQRPYTDQEVQQMMTDRGNIVEGFRKYLQTNPWNTQTSTSSLTPGMVLANPPLLKNWLRQYQKYKSGGRASQQQRRSGTDRGGGAGAV
jgi:hypothetical protein